MSFEQHVLDSIRHIIRSLKRTGDKTLDQLELEDMLWQPPGGANSVAIIIRHLHGNMMSRWTDFLFTDGEKPWRNRDAEFELPNVCSKSELVDLWETGWSCALGAIESLTAADMMQIVTIREQEHTVLQALHRQLQHISYHVGQLVMLARMRKGDAWRTLSIPKGSSKDYRPGGGLGEAKGGN